MAAEDQTYDPGASSGSSGYNPSYAQDAQGGWIFNGEAQNPNDAAGGGNDTQAQAYQAWLAANPQYAAVAQQNTPNGQIAQPASPLASLFQPGYLGAPATVDPTTAGYTPAQSANYDLNGLYGNWAGASTVNNAPQLDPSLTGSLGSGATIQQLLQGYAPQAQQQQNNLTQMLANFGVGGGQAIGADTQLQAQQTAALAPSIASAIQNSQANQLNAGEFNANNDLQTLLANAGFQNTNTNNLNSTLASALGQNASNQQATNVLNANNNLQNNQFNATQTQNAATGNANALNSTNAANVAEQNQAQQQMIQDMMNQYYEQLQAFNNINNAGQGAGNQNAINYGQDITVQQDPFTQIFGALAGAGGQIGAAAVGKP